MTGSDLCLWHEPHSADAAGVLRLRGDIDMADCRTLDHQLRSGTEYLVVDLSEVTLLSPAAIGVIITHSERLMAAGGGLFVVAGTPQIRRLLQLTRADEALDTYPSVPDALAACAGSADADRQDVRLGETAALRRRLRTRPTISRAIGMLQERYGLPDGDVAFTVLRESSQQYNLRLHRVAAAVLAAPPPRLPSAEFWFPGRVRAPAPALTFVPWSVASDGNRSAVLDALLAAMSACVGTASVDPQLADVPGHRLRLARHHGLTAEVVDVIDHEEYAATAPRAAHRSRQRVVADVETDPIFADPAVRLGLLSGGSRALQSSPLPTASGRRPPGQRHPGAATLDSGALDSGALDSGALDSGMAACARRARTRGRPGIKRPALEHPRGWAAPAGPVGAP